MAAKTMAAKKAMATKLVKEVPGEEEKPQVGIASTSAGMATKDADGMATKQRLGKKISKDFRGKDL
eukprot:11320855-Karenia_brevis.AAC.1